MKTLFIPVLLANSTSVHASPTGFPGQEDIARFLLSFTSWLALSGCLQVIYT